MAYRVRRRHHRLPTSLVIESAVNISAQFRFAASALPMNASDFWGIAGTFTVLRYYGQVDLE